MSTLFEKLARALVCRLPETGSGRLIDRTPLARWHISDSTVTIACRPDVLMRVNPNDLVGRHLYFRGCFDPIVRDVLVGLAKPGDVFWDVGANVAYMSCCILQAVPGAKAVMVEPLPDIFEMAKENVERAGGDRAVCVRAAISDQHGIGKMTRRKGNTGASHILAADEPESVATDEVEMITARELLARTPGNRVDLVKIDVEGHEAAVFRAFAELSAAEWPRSIVFEHHTKTGVVSPEIVRVLSERGYSIWRICKRVRGWVLVRHDGKAPKGFVDTADFITVSKVEELDRLGVRRIG